MLVLKYHEQGAVRVELLGPGVEPAARSAAVAVFRHGEPEEFAPFEREGEARCFFEHCVNVYIGLPESPPQEEDILPPIPWGGLVLAGLWLVNEVALVLTLAYLRPWWAAVMIGFLVVSGWLIRHPQRENALAAVGFGMLGTTLGMYCTLPGWAFVWGLGTIVGSAAAAWLWRRR